MAYCLSLREDCWYSLYGLNTSHEVWTALAHRYASPSKSRINNLRRQLQNLRQGTQTCSDFFLGAKSIADQLALVGQPIGDEDLISYIVGGLSPQYNPFIASLWAGKDRSLRVDDFQSELLNYEQLLEHQMASVDRGSFALYSHKPNGPKGKPKLNNGKPRTGQYRPSSGRPTYGQQHGASYSQPNGSPRPSSGPRPSYNPATSSHPGKSGLVPSITDTSIPVPCQICGKNYHNALDCFHRMDYAYQGRHPPSELAAMVSQCNALRDEDDWLADSGANNHITAELENLTLQEPYQGTESVAVGNGNGLSILHTGSSTLHTPKSILHLKEILHCPEASANLLSINKFCRDNNYWFKLTDTYFLVKDNLTGEILLQGPSENGLYPVQLQTFIKNKREQGHVALLGVKTSSFV